MFYGREKEIKQIRDILNRDDAQSVMIYGKRRVGKSALILESIKTCNCRVIYYECLLTTMDENLRNLESRVQREFGSRYLHFEDWAELFEFLGEQRDKVVIILDEYSYLKAITPKNYVDSVFQTIIDRMSGNVSLVLLGSYVGMMKELMEKENPLFGRFSLILHVKPFDYLDAAMFYPACSVRQKVEFYGVFGGTPFACRFISGDKSLKENVENLLLDDNAILRAYVENILLSELSKVSSANLILSVLASGKKRYSELENAIGMKTNGALDKQLKNLIEMEVVRKVYPINKKGDRKKTFYEISDNLIRFYYSYIFHDRDVIQRIGEITFYQEYIQPSIHTFLSHRFEEIAREYFSRRSGKSPHERIQDIGTFWYDCPAEHRNGEFDCVIQQKNAYAFYEVKYYQEPLNLSSAEAEEQQIYEMADSMPVGRIGFVCLSGFSFEDDRYDLITGEQLYTR